jgi:luciferase family oxidoreductase group 1
MARLSVLDQSPVRSGARPAEAIQETLTLAEACDRLGYTRYWLAEHHNIPGVASAATAVVIGHVAGGTSRIRVGAGGIMLPNHSPLVIAEQFGTLASLYPGRIDLGLGRAPGGDHATARALRRYLAGGADTFADDVRELMSYFRAAEPGQTVRAIPGEGLDVPVYVLGSSDYGARLAAELGLPYAFASHFAPAALVPAIQVYRERFQPSTQLDQPYVMLAANVIIADTDEAARKLATSQQKSFIDGAFRRKRTLLQPPIDNIDDYWHPQEKAQLESMLSCSFIGSIETVQEQVTGFIAEHQPDELIVATSTFDQQARLDSLERLASLTDAAVRA